MVTVTKIIKLRKKKVSHPKVTQNCSMMEIKAAVAFDVVTHV